MKLENNGHYVKLSLYSVKHYTMETSLCLITYHTMEMYGVVEV
jgi:hypothetical protein